jgi:dipeptidyl aminopeptidase/acylaminoacyl peptidase
MTQKTTRPFGMWPSPITPASLAQSLRLSDVAWDSDGETLVWLEGRSDRGVLACASSGQAFRDLTSILSVRARVGYGGGDMAVAGGCVYFVAQPGSSQAGRLYRQPLAGGEATPITPPFGHMASPAPSPDRRWVVYVYTLEGEDGLAIVDAAGKGWPQKLVAGQDFYMQPCWHPGGTRLAWVSWDHPNMPWDSTMLRMAILDVNGRGLPVVAETQTLVDKPDVAVFQPQFSPDGRSLAYVSDEGGWGNLWLYDLELGEGYPLTTDPVDVIRPAWVQGIRTYGFSPNGRCIFYVRNEAGFDRLWVYDLDAREARAVNSPLNDYTSLGQIAVAPSNGMAAGGMAAGSSLAFVASSSTVGGRVVAWDPMCPAPTGAKEERVYRRATGETISSDDLSTPQPVHWAAGDGMTVHGLYYPPTSSRYAGTGLPPAIIAIHGGPTGQSTASYSARAQFFTSRGYAYLEVNYRGSTGYGKPYMAALRGQWGVLDVEDAIGGAQYLVDAGLADAARLVIMGGSAGGYTVLKCLVDHPGFFRAALCLYGVSNMFTLAADTHKFEERYLDSMLGPLPEAGAVYRERSPIFNADRIVDPIAVFQGEIDRVVPVAQAEAIVESLRRRGVPHEYHLYQGEGHGWRKQETIEAFYTTVERFLRQYVIFA